ncbi:MAG: prephenate dehydratase [Alphaproteobacteria bacterium]|nr:prephenate dehydratase [Alphaproteobacteria bacterium]
MRKRVAFEGISGAYSELACREALPEHQTIPCPTVDNAIAAVHEGRADIAMIPVENTAAGRVAAVHALLPQSGLSIIGEHYQRVEHHLLAHPQATLADIKEARSHVHALPQCKRWLAKRNIVPVVRPDTAGSAEEVAKLNDKSVAAIASRLAGDLYGLKSLAADIAELPGNTTRCLILSPKESRPRPEEGPCITTLLYRTQNIPSALYKTLGGFATNGINITRLESYFTNGSFNAAQFWIDVEGHADEPPLRRALEELTFYAEKVTILGVYLAAAFRRKAKNES